MNEADLQKKILEYLTAKGAWCVKYHASQYTKEGVPDILGCYRGFFFAIEVKHPERPSAPIRPAQKIQLARIHDAEGVTLVARNFSSAKAWIDFHFLEWDAWSPNTSSTPALPEGVSYEIQGVRSMFPIIPLDRLEDRTTSTDSSGQSFSASPGPDRESHRIVKG